MLDLSLSEVGLIAVVAVLALDPEDVPAIMRTCRKWWKELRSVTDELKAGVQDIMEEPGADDIKPELDEDAKNTPPKYIEDQQGNLQRVYDVSDLAKEKKKAADE